MDCVFGVVSKKESPHLQSSKISPLLPSRGLIVLIYESVCLNFSEVCRFISLYMGVQLFKCHLLKMIHHIVFAFCQRSVDSAYGGLFRGCLCHCTGICFYFLFNLDAVWLCLCVDDVWTKQNVVCVLSGGDSLQYSFLECYCVHQHLKTHIGLDG